jgi:hypothetical protein
MNNYQKSIEAYKAKNGGTLPSDLYTMTNSELGNMLYNLTGDIKHKMGRVSKEALVKRVLKLTNPSASTSGSKRKADASETISTTAPPTKLPRGCLSVLSHIQLAQMKRVLTISDIHLQGLKHDKDLRPLWSSIGMTSMYPNMTGKEKVMEKMKTFAENNLRHHGHLSDKTLPIPSISKQKENCIENTTSVPSSTKACVVSHGVPIASSSSTGTSASESAAFPGVAFVLDLTV